jgi:arylsulfatase A-like enzyme
MVAPSIRLNVMRRQRENTMQKLRILLGVPVAMALGLFIGTQSASATCQLNSPGGKITRVVYIIFDNVHLRRDNPNVPSDLEQMPTLLNFLQGKGVINGNHHTPLISHTADDILTGLTGVYGDRHGSPISNSFGIFKADNSSAVFQTSFVYWTTTTAQSHPEAGENLPVLVNENGKNAPAPWPVFTRAGCDVGAFSLNGLAIENKTDIANIFGSTVAASAATQDYEGIAIHCAKGSPLCNNSLAKPDLLPDEPAGYTGFSGLFGNINVQPAISPGAGNFVQDLDGVVITDPLSNKPGFPTNFDPSATASLGYAAKMLEAGVQVVYTYIADAHDPQRLNIPNAPPAPNNGHAYGPGEAGYVAALKSYDQAFGKFFARLKAHGIDETNTLFVVVPDENDHFVGGPASPANCDGVTTPCTYKNVGEIEVSTDKLLLQQRMNSTKFSVHSDDAPNFYIGTNPAATDTLTRTMEHDVDALTATNPITGASDKMSKLLADRAEMKLLHMVTASPQRTPSFTMFGNDNYFFETGNNTGCATPTDVVCEAPGFAWNHGDFQRDITQTWVAMVGPGVRRLGRHDEVFTDHADVRPTLMSLLGLTDDYVHEGRVVAEFMNDNALPSGIRKDRENFVELAKVFKQLNAPKGELGRASLVWANRSVTATDNVYAGYLKEIGKITADRDELAVQIKTVLNNAAFHSQRVGEGDEDGLGHRARSLIDRVKRLADEDHRDHDRRDDDHRD